MDTRLTFLPVSFVFRQLLEKDASIRLGVLNTMDEESDIKYHPFFNSIIWDKLERRAVEPPFKPQVVSSRNRFLTVIIVFKFFLHVSLELAYLHLALNAKLEDNVKIKYIFN